MPREPLQQDEIIAFLDECLEVEFSFVKSDIPAADIIQQPRPHQDFILNLTRRVAATNIELAYQLACHSARALEAMELHMVEAWAMTATDNYDKQGLFPAMSVIKNLDQFVQTVHTKKYGSVLEEETSVLLPFLQGLAGRKLKIAEADVAYTDTETVYLPAISAQLENKKQNFLIYKATVAYLWAQIQFGSFRINLSELMEDDDRLNKFRLLESIRLEACIERELPGLYRDMQMIKAIAHPEHKKVRQRLVSYSQVQSLLSEQASAFDSLGLIDKISVELCQHHYCYQGVIKLEQVASVLKKRTEKEKAYFRVALSELAKDHQKKAAEENGLGINNDSPVFNLKQKDEQALQSGNIEFELDGELITPPEHVRELITSIVIDFGEIPPEYLVAAGPGEYDLKKFEDEQPNPEDVWKGTYHEEGAELYNEWNFKRQYYHKNWCVLRELEIPPVYDSFVQDTLHKHRGLLKSLRHTFEVLRGEDRLLKRQPYGDDIDIDALVDALSDTKSGMEMSERVFTKMHKEDRNVAVIFMVDMSGSTRGWINEAERESLILLAEVLEILGDRYAIYGFSGMTRKRCELYKIKSFDEDYNDEVRARISNIQPKDYTRMGVFIRHMTRIFSEVEASTKLLITLSDGKPDDYDTYRGEYGVEDTRQALYEAHRDGIHPFCITIDEQARDYLPHMYGAANYAVIDDVAKLPQKVSDIYRRITS
ncbi:MAG: nitric oxide reductase activation protein [Gammaproteobacteria bacterium]|nr:nitric oxide reductase activation protein [Gammaproteobacteria bacterium]